MGTRSTKRPRSNPIRTASLEHPGVGLVLADSSLNPIYANPQAVQILAFPEKFEAIKAQKSFLAAKTRSILPDGDLTREPPTNREVISGNRRYVCRIVPLNPYKRNSSGPTVALLLERPSGGLYDIRKVCEHYHLTPREQQAVELLVQGLVGKEIAERMGISPNTVKAFLRLVMIKMGVTTRSGIMAKMIHSTS